MTQADTYTTSLSADEARGGDGDSAIRSVAFVSLGCPKNTVDSEKMLGLLAESGLTIAGEDEADAIVINTCGFLEASKEESVEELNRAAARKQSGSLKRLVAAGCLVQRHRAKLLDWCPQIDALIGVYDRDRVIQAVTGVSEAEAGRLAEEAAGAGAAGAVSLPVYSSIASSSTLAKRERGIDAAGYFESDAARLRITPRHYAYLRMSEGCNQNCAFCTIPSIRGKMRSKPVEAILTECRELVTDGVFEVNLIGQDTTSYGEDIGYGPGLAGLLGELDRFAQRETGPSGMWFRLMYAYPSCFTDEMIDAIAASRAIVPYIDMPLQHINDAVLDRMRRRTSRALIETLLGKLRERVPGIALRTTFITGFPGETDAQHAELVEFVREFGFDHMGVFKYSPEPDTPAGTLHERGEAVADEVMDARYEELMLAQQEVAFARNEALLDAAAEVDVLIDAESEGMGVAGEGGDDIGEGAEGSADEPFVYEGRMKSQAPGIDSVTYVVSREARSPGEVVRGKVVGVDGYDVVAEAIAVKREGVSLPVIG